MLLAKNYKVLYYIFMSNKAYITTAIPYVNGAPHVGHALDYCLADVYARYSRLRGFEVRLQTGVDEHGNKIYQKASDMGIQVNTYVDGNAKKFRDFIEKLDVSYTDFIRTTDETHARMCQEIWRRLLPHIYKSEYEGWYCDGCERFITQKEYDDNSGVCPDHQKAYKKISEENYYLRISDFKDKIHKAIESDELLILPEFRKKEVLKLLEESPDVSISRSVEQLSWGIPVPDDESQVMYVWIDALSNYITVLGYPEEDVSAWWPAEAQFVGKDILRFHAIIWPAMLMGLGLPLPKTIVSHGFVLVDGQKMSKTIGNVVDTIDVLDRHGVDAFRYYFLRHIDTFSDSDFTWEKFESAYNNELANDLGNLVQRLATLASKNHITIDSDSLEYKFDSEYIECMDKFEFSKAFDCAWEKVQGLNKRIDDEKPWVLAKNGEAEKAQKCLLGLISDLLNVNYMLSPFIPGTAARIYGVFTEKEIIPPKTPLFPKD